MYDYGFLGFIASILALLISIAVFIGHVFLHRKVNRIQFECDVLTGKEKIPVSSNDKKKKSNLSVSIDKSADGGYRFILTNNTESDIKDVEMDILLDDPKESPMTQSEYSSTFPIVKFARGASIKLAANLYASGPSSYNVLLKWTTPDGSRVEDEISVPVSVN